ncbi:MAG: putative peptidoglycan lipid flippase [Solirubrobacteraceae bacterium]|jgi:putative peptidoglycan lipid II flippase|nr:putative peptidoglycan lipid flippase [Solirubrobacteraceae bacterium]
MAAETRPRRGRTPATSRGIAGNTAIFSILTGGSRIAGLVREIVASTYFGTSGPMSAFTFAFQIPNLVRSLFADAAISAAFVPVFTELLEKGQKRDAYRLASAFVVIIVAALTTVTVLFTIAAPVIMPLLTGDFSPQLDQLTVGLSQVLFPIVLLLGLNGLFVGILNAHDHFTIPALAPLVWNVVIIGTLVALKPRFHGPDELYAYAIAVVAGTVVQLVMCMPVLGRLGFRFDFRRLNLKDGRVRQVLTLMFPITLSLGIINFDLVINTILGSTVSDETPAAIDRAFRLYMLPQGMFSVAVATVLFPALSRLATRKDYDGLRALLGTGVRQIALLLLPAAVCTLVLAEPITRLVYQRGAFGTGSTALVSEALFWFSFSLPFAGINLLLTRTFFSLQRPWLPTAISAGSLVVNLIVSIVLVGPFGIAGVVVGTAVASAAMAAGQAYYLRRELSGRLEGYETTRAIARITLACVLLAGISYGVWYVVDGLLGRSLPAQIISVGGGLTAGIVVYCRAVLRMRVEEAQQIRALVRARLGR